MGGRVAEHRARMKARGYKEVRYWVPDVSSPEFAARIQAELRQLNQANRDDGTANALDELQTETLSEL